MITQNKIECEHNHEYTTEHNSKHNSEREIEEISRKIQQGVWDCTSNPLVPKSFQMPVDSGSLVAAIESIAVLVRTPLEEKLRAQQEQIARLQEIVQRLQAARE